MKISIIGYSGAGKSTTARKLGEKLGIPVLHLDTVYHMPGWQVRPNEDSIAIVSKFMEENDSWIIDGNYSRTLEARLKSCDTVFMLDFPTDVCMQGVVERIGKKRKDMPWVDTELDQGLKLEIEKFPKETRPHIFELLEKYGDDKNVVVFKSRDEADAFLRNFKKG